MPDRSQARLSFWPPRNCLWKVWRLYDRHFPVQRGKYRAAKILEVVAGLPVASVQGIALELFPPSSIDGELLENGDFDAIVREAIDEFVGLGDVFIDVGANIGWFSLYAAFKTGAEVWAFEPSVRERLRLERNIRLNGCNVRVLPVALGSANAEWPFVLAGDGNRGANRLGVQTADENLPRCVVRRLESVIPSQVLKRVRLVKLDVEGWEVEVLKGIGGAFDSLRKAAFVVEVSPSWLRSNGSSAEELYEILTSHGWKPREKPRTTAQWDAVFLPPET